MAKGELACHLIFILYSPSFSLSSRFFATTCPHAHSQSNLAPSLADYLLTVPWARGGYAYVSVCPGDDTPGLSAWQFRILGICCLTVQRSQKAFLGLCRFFTSWSTWTEVKNGFSIKCKAHWSQDDTGRDHLT